MIEPQQALLDLLAGGEPVAMEILPEATWPTRMFVLGIYRFLRRHGAEHVRIDIREQGKLLIVRAR